MMCGKSRLCWLDYILTHNMSFLVSDDWSCGFCMGFTVPEINIKETTKKCGLTVSFTVYLVPYYLLCVKIKGVKYHLTA